MIVGILRLGIRLAGVRSLKEKRAAIRPVLEHCRRHFNGAAAEVSLQDSHDVSGLGFSVVSTSEAHAARMLESIAASVGERLEVAEIRTEYLRPGFEEVFRGPSRGESGSELVGSWSDHE